MKDLFVRECTIADSEAICRLNRESLGYDYPPEKTREKLTALLSRETDKVFVAELCGEVVGYIHAAGYDVLYAPHFKDIMGIAVRGDMRRQGVGRTLLSRAEEWACESGAEGIRLVSGAERIGAHEFYRRCGYGGKKMQINFKKMFR